jgi:transcription elongation factor GreA
MKTRRDELLAKREIVLVSLQRAREMGDLSENGAYTSAKFELGNVDRELRKLEFNLKYGEVVEANESGVVGFGSRVTVELNGKEYTYLLVSSEESNPNEMKLSIDSPVGQALMGHKVGDKVSVVMPGRTIEYLITRVD